MFRLDVSHLQAPIITLPDALSTLGSHSVYMWITYLLELIEITRLLLFCRLCLSNETLQHKTPSYLVRRCSLDASPVGCLCHIKVWSVCAVMLGGVFLEVFLCRYLYFVVPLFSLLKFQKGEKSY